MPQTCLDETGLKIVGEIYKAVQNIRDDSGLLAPLGSWGDTMDDQDVLDMLVRHNEMTARNVRS